MIIEISMTTKNQLIPFIFSCRNNWHKTLYALAIILQFLIKSNVILVDM